MSNQNQKSRQGADVAVIISDNGEEQDVDMERTENKNQPTHEGAPGASSSLLKRSRATDDDDIILIED